MAKDTHHYSNKEITVVWKPAACVHSTICWKGLAEVFNPRERPWVKMDGAATDKIIEQVKKCPSGALSYISNADTLVKELKEAPGELPDVLKVEVTANGPYLISSACLIVHSNGREEIKTDTVALCRCGSSQNKPYCDGNHNNAGFKG